MSLKLLSTASRRNSLRGWTSTRNTSCPGFKSKSSKRQKESSLELMQVNANKINFFFFFSNSTCLLEDFLRHVQTFDSRRLDKICILFTKKRKKRKKRKWLLSNELLQNTSIVKMKNRNKKMMMIIVICWWWPPRRKITLFVSKIVMFLETFWTPINKQNPNHHHHHHHRF